MMEIGIRDTHDKKYLVISGLNGSDVFDERMIANLDSPYILCPLKENVQTARTLKYDITGLVPMFRACSKKALGEKDIKRLVLDMSGAVKYLERHLLGDANILFDPDRVYMGGDGRLRLIAVFAQEGSFAERIRPFIKFLFLHADFENDAAVRLASGLYRESMQDDIRLHDLLKIMENEKKTGENNTLGRETQAGCAAYPELKFEAGERYRDAHIRPDAPIVPKGAGHGSYAGNSRESHKTPVLKLKERPERPEAGFEGGTGHYKERPPAQIKAAEKAAFLKNSGFFTKDNIIRAALSAAAVTVVIFGIMSFM